MDTQQEQIKEEWKPVVGYEGIYEVSNTGKINIINYRNLGYNKRRKTKVMFGYERITLIKGEHRQNIGVHRVVAMAFLPNTQNLPSINHKDENKLNNNVNNLEWCSVAYNNAYGTGRKRSAERRHRQVYKLNDNGDVIQKYDSLQDACSEFGVNTLSNIGAVCNGFRDIAYGYKWRWVDEKKNNAANKRRAKRKQHKKTTNNQKFHKIKQFTKDNVLVATYDTIQDAVNFTGINKYDIWHTCDGSMKSAGGFVFEFEYK